MAMTRTFREHYSFERITRPKPDRGCSEAEPQRPDDVLRLASGTTALRSVEVL